MTQRKEEDKIDGDDPDIFRPTPRQIAQATARIRQKWSAAEADRRAGFRRQVSTLAERPALSGKWWNGQELENR